MVPSGKTWKEKRIAREEAGSESEGGGGGSEERHSKQHEGVDVNMVVHLMA
jgi:hypothetical protein